MKPFNLAASAVTLAMVCGTLSCSSSPPAPAGSGATGVPGAQPMLAPHLPRSVANGTASMTGPVAPQQILRPVIQLPLRNQAELTHLLHDLYDPKSRKFHQYVSVSDFTARFAPMARDYAAVVAWTKKNGLKVIATTPNRRLIAAEGANGGGGRRVGHRRRGDFRNACGWRAGSRGAGRARTRREILACACRLNFASSRALLRTRSSIG